MTYTITERGRGWKTLDDEPQELYPSYETADAALAKAREYAAGDLRDGRYATAKSGCWVETAGVVFFEHAIAVPTYEVWENYCGEDERRVGSVSARDLDRTLDKLCQNVEYSDVKYGLGFVCEHVCEYAEVVDENDHGDRLVNWEGLFGRAQSILPADVFRAGAELLPRDGVTGTDFASVDAALASGVFAPATESDKWRLYAEVVDVAISAAL